MHIQKLFLLLFSLICLQAEAQWKWTNPIKTGFPVIQNQGWTEEIGDTYTRLPLRAEKSVRQSVWYLSRNSAGLALSFYSNAPEIKVRYTVKGSMSMPHMPATGVSGIDLYRIDSDGKWSFCFGNYSFQDTIQYSYTPTAKDKYQSRSFEYQLYLPLYNSVEWMEIGVPENSELTFIPKSTEKPIILYGTSIAQGACASRPGMAWSNILQRTLDYPLINLGFSGNGKLEKEVLNYICETDARLYILDCLPNLTDKNEETVTQLIVDAVKQIRQSHTAPILLSEHAGYSNAPTDTLQYQSYTCVNQASRKAYEKLQAEGIKDLYYISCEELNIPADGWVDSVHPTDLGAQVQATAVEKKIRALLNIPVGTLSTTQPVTQRREPNMYEWKKRHEDILALNRKDPPHAVILGNSIVHYWGGTPTAPSQHGPESWKKYMKPAGFRNMGYGWDKIENVLWRVYHGELDGYEADKIVLMIGTNNLDFNSNDEIAQGLRHLLFIIKDRQPKAQIKVIGILPRRDKEKRINELNGFISQVAQEARCSYSNPGINLLQKDGKIDESLFLDGLHPNENGYKKIAKIIAE